MNENTMNSRAFYCLPKALFSNQAYPHLSSLGKLLYAILLDRMSLSQRNGNQWRDGNGNVFIYYSLSEVAQVLCCSKDTASRLMKELEREELITRRRQGLGKPNRIWVWPLEKLRAGNKKPPFSSSSVLVFPDPEGEDSVTINPYEINKVINNYSHMSTEEATVFAKSLIHYDILCLDLDTALLDSVIEVIQDVFTQIDPVVYVAGKRISRCEVRQKLTCLDDIHIRYICDRIQTESRCIANPKAFILARLCDSKSVIDLFYQSLVDHDLKESKYGN